MTFLARWQTPAPLGNTHLPNLKFVEESASVPLLCRAMLTWHCTEEHGCLSLRIKCSQMDISFTEELLASSCPQPPYFPFPISTLQNSYWGLRLKLGSSLLSITPSKENQWANLSSRWCLHNLISVPVFAVSPLTVLMRTERKSENLAIVSAASSYDSEHTEAADLVSKMELFLPTPPLFFFFFK